MVDAILTYKRMFRPGVIPDLAATGRLIGISPVFFLTTYLLLTHLPSSRPEFANAKNNRTTEQNEKGGC